MNWTDFLLGAVTVVIGYVFLSIGLEHEDTLDEPDISENNIVVTNLSNKFFQLSCQTCRKIKNHREIAPRVFECSKCKRRTNLNVG
jgi:hypothetical protein